MMQKGTTKRPPPKCRPEKADGAGSDVFARIRRKRVLQSSQILLHPAVVNTQEFVGPGGHVDQVGLALGTFLVHELVHRVILRLGLDEAVHHQEQRPAQLRRAAFGGADALGLVGTGLVGTGIDTGEDLLRKVKP